MTCSAVFFAQTPPFYLSVDVEGMNLNLLRDMDFSRYRPYIVQTEPSEHYIPGNMQQTIEYMTQKDYLLLAQTDVNLIFIDKTALSQGLP